jgi:hypothetical protein
MSRERKHPRWSVVAPVRYQVFDRRGGEFTVGEICQTRAHDLAQDGAFLAHVVLPLGTRIHFYLELPENYGGNVEVFGEVVHDRPRMSDDGRARDGVGVRFAGLSPRDRSRIERFLAPREAIAAASLRADVEAARARANRPH